MANTSWFAVNTGNEPAGYCPTCSEHLADSFYDGAITPSIKIINCPSCNDELATYQFIDRKFTVSIKGAGPSLGSLIVLVSTTYRDIPLGDIVGRIAEIVLTAGNHPMRS